MRFLSSSRLPIAVEKIGETVGHAPSPDVKFLQSMSILLTKYAEKEIVISNGPSKIWPTVALGLVKIKNNLFDFLELA